MSGLSIGVVVLHYQFWPGIERTLEAIAAQTRPPIDMVVIDNNSSDHSFEALVAAFPDLDVRRTRQNLGYGGAMNVGVKALLGRRPLDAVLLLTHETVMALDCVELLAHRLEDRPEVGAVGPALGCLDDPDRIWSAGGKLDPVSWRESHFDTPTAMTDWVGSPTEEVDWLDGAAVMVRSTAWHDVGPLYEGYFLYFEDLDYCCRLRQRGWKVECVRGAQAWQRSNAAIGRLWTRNRLRFLARNAPRRVFLKEFLRTGAGAYRPRNRYSPASAARREGWNDFIRRRVEPPG